jgi:hypothetical protein
MDDKGCHVGTYAMNKTRTQVRSNIRLAKHTWGTLSSACIETLNALTRKHNFSVAAGEILLIEGRWYITHAGLLRLARRCVGIDVEPITEFSEPSLSRYAFKATLYRSHLCKGFVGYGDADPSNVSALVRGAEMRVAETRAVNRALRKAYGIGLCSVEEFVGDSSNVQISTAPGKIPPQPAGGSGANGRKVRDQLCQIIRQHQLDPNLVKAYAVDYCGVKTLKDATREQVQNFVKELSNWAAKDRSALLCQLNSYLGNKEGAA